MISPLIAVIIFIIFVLVVFWLLGYATIPQPARNIIYTILALIFIIVFIEHFGPLLGFGVGRHGF